MVGVEKVGDVFYLNKRYGGFFEFDFWRIDGEVDEFRGLGMC